MTTESRLELTVDSSTSGRRNDDRATKTRCGRACALSILVLFLLVAVAVGIFLIIYFLGPKSKVLVTLPVGSIRGRMVASPQGHLVQEFLGIPFAKPPVGALRYADPVPYGRITEDPYEADSYKHSCWQYLDTTYGDFLGSDMWNAKNGLSEDCLYLNVWAPESSTGTSNKAVIVWIYGGGFYGGSSQLWVYDGKALAAYGDVIVVSMNYRVGSFGFLATGDGRIKGNFGLKDQQVALLWVKENIIHFGGDPSNVTLFGESAGAASVGYHTMNPISAATFQRTIYQSGSPEAHWAFLSHATMRARSQSLFQSVNCPDDEAILECLRNKSVEDIFNVEWVTSEFLNFPWAPNIDGDFLTDTPSNILKSGKYSKKDSILGTNLDEGTFWNLYALPGLSKDHESVYNYSMYLDAVAILDWDLSPSDLRVIQEMYSPQDRSNMAANRDALDDVSGDRSFTCPTLSLARTLTMGGVSTYVYLLTHRASNEVWPAWMGVIHGAEIQWVFGMPLNTSRGYTIEEIEFSRALMDYWVQFAKTGSPNGGNLPLWPLHSNADQYLVFSSADTSTFRVEASLKSEYCSAWDSIRESRNG